MSVVIPYLFSNTDRHGNVRHYARKRGMKQIRIREPYGSPEFLEALAQAVKQLTGATSMPALRQAGPAPKTLSWAVQEYEKSVDFKQLDPKTQRTRRSEFEHSLAEPVKPGSPHKMGGCPLDKLEAVHFRIMRDQKADKKHAANGRIKAWRVMMDWAVEAQLVKRNFADDVKYLKVETEGYHSWTPEEVKQFEDFHPIGSTPRLALALMLYTGVRRSDAVAIGPTHIKDGVLAFTPFKTRRKVGKNQVLPVLAQLQAIIDATPTGKTTFIVSSIGRSYTADHFGRWFRVQCDAAGLPNCTAHGLRKAGAVIAAENGATEKQMMAIFNWDSPALAAHYSKKANQKKMAGVAMHLIAAA